MTSTSQARARHTPNDAPDDATLIQRAKDLQGVLRERAEGTEAARVVDPRTIADFQRAGFFKMFQSRTWGGYESHPTAIFTVQELLAQACPSSAWIMGVVGVHNWQLAHFSKRAQQEVWGADPGVLASSSYAPTGSVRAVDGGCVLRGRWFYSSGIDHVDWVLLGGNVTDASGQTIDYRTFLVPKSDYRIVDDWHVIGLKGTGSKSLEIDEAFVPEHRQLSVLASQAFDTPGLREGTAGGPLFRVPFPTIFGSCITTPALGAAQRMLDLFVEMTRQATSLYSGARWAEEQTTQIRIAECDAELRAARMQQAANFDQIIARLERGETVPIEERARFRFDHCNLVDLAHRAADRLFVASGARSLMTSQPFQRFFLDIQAARVHAINNRGKWAATYGGSRLGVAAADMLGQFV